MALRKKNIEPVEAPYEQETEETFSNTSLQSATKHQLDYASLIHELTLPIGWSVSIADVLDQKQVRLDAEHYDPRVVENNKRLQELGFDLLPLSNYAKINLPNMFTRIWAQDKQHGVPYINATDLMSYFAVGIPAQERFLSYATEVNMDNLIIRKGMILITCSGTIGRVFDVPEELDGCAGTHDIVRIIPYDPAMRGFIRTYLTTSFAQIQILSHTHGGQIDHVTGEQIGSCLIPVLPNDILKCISAKADTIDALRAQRLVLLEAVSNDLHEALINGK